MSIRSTVWAVSIMMVFSTALVACGHKDESKTKTRKASTLEAPKGGTGADADKNKRIANGELEQLAPSDKCEEPFADFTLADGEREIKFADLAKPETLQLAAALKDKDVAFELVSIETLTKVNDPETKKVDQVQASFKKTSVDTAETRVVCHTIRRDSDEKTNMITGSVNLPDILNLTVQKAQSRLLIEMIAKPQGVSAKLTQGELNEVLKDINFKRSELGAEPEVVLSRRGADEIVLKLKASTMVENGKKTSETRVLAIYKAYELDGAADDGGDVEGGDADDADAKAEAAAAAAAEQDAKNADPKKVGAQ